MSDNKYQPKLFKDDEGKPPKTPQEKMVSVFFWGCVVLPFVLIALLIIYCAIYGPIRIFPFI